MIPHETIEILSCLWWKSNIITISSIFIILYIGKKIPNQYTQYLTYLIGLSLIIRSIGIHLYWNYINIWTIESSLPLHLCGLSAILSGVALLWKNQTIYELLYYWGISGALHSLLTPEFTSGIGLIRFIDYYISHGGIILAALYLTLIIEMRPRKGSWYKIFLYSQILLPIIGIINWILNSNYMYLSKKPIVDNPFLLGDWPWYILSIEFAGLIHFIILYIPFNLNFKLKIKL